MYICICNAVTERAVRECAGRGAKCLEDLAFHLGVGAGCGRCRDCATELLKETTSTDTSRSEPPALVPDSRVRLPRAV
jgi:bacterioferritin-associated ferredoxin